MTLVVTIMACQAYNEGYPFKDAGYNPLKI
jgi:hypothetical protein